MTMMRLKIQQRQRQRPKKSVKGLVYIICISAIVALVMISHESGSQGILTRFLSSKSSLLSYQDCHVHSISLPTQPIIPTFAASYPGSGSQMTHYLFEALTGLEAGDEWYHRGDSYDHVTIKTHYPARPHQVEGSRLLHRVILLIRNPLHAIPSYHNYIYEKEHGLQDHTVRAPASTWIQWRDEHFNRELMNWRQHLLYWMTNFDSENRLVISYERLVHSKVGPLEAMRIADFLRKEDNVQIVPTVSEINCVWDKVVNYHRVELDQDGETVLPSSHTRKLVYSIDADHQAISNGDNNNNINLNDPEIQHYTTTTTTTTRRVKYISQDDPEHPGNSLRKGDVKYEYTKQQLETIRAVLNELRGTFLKEYTLVTILTGYVEEINDELKSMK